MQFQCDRCGKRYSTGQEIREGRAYRFKCRACGHDVIVRGPQGAQAGGLTSPSPSGKRNGNGVQPAGDLPQAVSRPLTETPATISVVNPGDVGPPPGGYLEFRLDNDVVTTQSTITAALTDAPGREITPPPSPFLARPATPPAAPATAMAPVIPEPALDPAPGEPTPGLSGEARAGGAGPEPAPTSRRRLLVGLVAVIPAVVVILLFGGLWSGSERGATSAAPAGKAPAKVPGLLTPQIYVGPLTFESPTPQLEPSAAAPVRPSRPAAAPRPPPPRREVAPARKPAAVARTTTGRTAEPPLAPAGAAPAAAPDPGPRTASASPVEPPAPEPEPAAAEPEPAPASPAPVQTPPPAVAAAPVPLPPPPAAASDEPVFAGPGFRRPSPVAPGCIERNVRIPQSSADRLPPSVMLRFAVGRDGSADLVQVLPGPDRSPNERIEPQVAQALTQAVRGCRFTPGADESGRLARLWVMMRVRFAE